MLRNQFVEPATLAAPEVTLVDAPAVLVPGPLEAPVTPLVFRGLPAAGEVDRAPRMGGRIVCTSLSLVE
ncbi:hypothetical protein GCM10009563_19460 [Subtercola frigoramans]